MSTSAFRAIAAVTVAVLTATAPTTAPAQVLNGSHPWTYKLIAGSQVIEDCPICDIPVIPAPLRGTFQLRFVSQNTLWTTYALENIAFTGTNSGGRNYKITGQGTYTVGGEVAVLQTLSLAVSIDNGAGAKLCYLTNALGTPSRLWPMLQSGVDQTNGTAGQQYHLDLDAAPFREIWFATAQPFEAGIWNPPSNSISAGDLISSEGRVVRRNAQLTASLGIMPIVPDLGLSGVNILSGGEIAFSITQNAFSETLGQLYAGDILSDRGRIVATNSALIAAFQPSPAPSGGAGPGAVSITDSGAIDFSIQTGFYSEKLQRTINPGDLLSSNGVVIRSNAQLLAAFNPATPSGDYGLTALYSWPSGELWFSTAKGFYDSGSNYYAAGDLLSDSGYVVYRNADLVSAFDAPVAGNGYGLNSLYVISDATPVLGPCQFAPPQATEQPPNSLALQWSGAGRVFQLERSHDVQGPYSPVSPIDTALSFVDEGALTNQVQTFYQLQQW